MITRAEYMNDSANLHHAYYAELAEAIGFKWTDKATIERFRKALETDEHMNNIPPAWWDAYGYQMLRLNPRLVPECKKRGEVCGKTLDVTVCILKAAARVAVEKADA